MSALSQRWGKPVERDRKFEVIEESHRSRLAHTACTGSLDDRTWADLNMDAVFTALDRTESTAGQHALYHRLRTAPVARHLGAFEALVTRMSGDSTMRERAQPAHRETVGRLPADRAGDPDRKRADVHLCA